MVVEVFCSLIFVVAGVFIHDRGNVVTSPWCILGVYVLTALVPFFLVRRQPLEASRVRDIEGGSRPVVWLGIIDTVWLLLMGLTCTLILAGQNLEIVTSLAPPANRSADFYHEAINECLFFLTFVTTSLFAVGGALGGCMAILWSGPLWRKHDPTSRSQYRAHTIASLKMVMAFCVILVAAFMWAAVPLHLRISQLRELMPRPK